MTGELFGEKWVELVTFFLRRIMLIWNFSGKKKKKSGHNLGPMSFPSYNHGIINVGNDQDHLVQMSAHLTKLFGGRLRNYCQITKY